jgi:hypothetical protein
MPRIYSFQLLGIAFPSVSEMPKRGYRLNKDETFLLRYSTTYKDDGDNMQVSSFNRNVDGVFVWDERNILGDGR